jgi:hypothetical protein
LYARAIDANAVLRRVPTSVGAACKRCKDEAGVRAYADTACAVLFAPASAGRVRANGVT